VSLLSGCFFPEEETSERDWRLAGALEFTQATATTSNIYLLK